MIYSPAVILIQRVLSELFHGDALQDLDDNAERQARER